MFRVILPLIIGLASFAYLVGSCNKKNDFQYNPTPVSFVIPPGFPQPVYDFNTNPLTEEGIALGRYLFYDGILSKDGNYPCASCHQQNAAFATYDHDFSHGFGDKHTDRNAPGLYNLAWQKAFHHDGAIINLNEEPIVPLTHPDQMAESLDNVVQKLKNNSKFRRLFTEAFGTDNITSQLMLQALGQFTSTLVSANSKYDRVKNGTASFTSFEQRGEAIFLSNCASCHTPPLFTDLSYRNNGLRPDPYLDDKGRMKVTNNPGDAYKFKVPSLRNVAASFPYMHDGRYHTLELAIEHYRSIPFSPTLDQSLVTGIGLSNADVVDLVQFLKTLTDSAFLKDPRYAKP